MPVAHPVAGEFGGRQITPGVDVGTGAKGALAFGRDNDAANVSHALQTVEMAGKLLQHLDREGIQFRRVVQPDLGNAIGDVEVNGTHGVHPIGSFDRSVVEITRASGATVTRPCDAATISRSGSMPGMISVATRPLSVSRMTQRSVM